MIKKHFLPLLPALLAISTVSIAGAGSDGKLLLLEGGLGYSHAFYKNSVVAPESITATSMGGSSFDPSNHYPNNFWGGYIGASLYTGCWLLNTRYDLYVSDDKAHAGSGTKITFAPVRLSFSVDKVWGDIYDLSAGAGLGAVIENTNKGTFNNTGTDQGTQLHHSLDGHSRIDPMLEAFVMKNIAERVAVKFNVGYQFAAHSRTGNGDVNVNLGLNYAFPV